MNTNTQHQIKVGIFVFLGVVAALSSIILLGGDKSLFKNYAILYTIMPQTQGLNKGSVVSLSGVNIGNVSDITFSGHDDGLKVSLKIEREYLNVIKKDATVALKTQGALGDKYLYISAGTAQTSTVSDQDFLMVEKSGDLLDVLSNRSSDAEKIFDVIRETHRLLASLNSGGKLDKIMTNIADASSDLKEASHEARSVMAELKPSSATQLREGLQHLNSVLSKIDNGEGTLGALVNDRSLYRNLKSMMANDGQQQYMKSVLRTSIKQDQK